MTARPNYELVRDSYTEIRNSYSPFRRSERACYARSLTKTLLRPRSLRKRRHRHRSRWIHGYVLLERFYHRLSKESEDTSASASGTESSFGPTATTVPTSDSESHFHVHHNDPRVYEIDTGSCQRFLTPFKSTFKRYFHR